MIEFPNAKINLGLNVVGRRSDGYHELETCFYPIDVCDALEIIPADTASLNIVGTPIDGDIERNLVVRAFRLLQSNFQLPELKITLLKKIPMGAGLGGGSSDAAFMLKLLNKQFQLNLSNEQLETYAARLGADCAFFVRDVPAYATGIGEQLEPIALSLKGWKILLVKPQTHISTAEAYAHVACKRWKMPLKEVLQLPVNQWKNYMFNDFEESVFPEHPELNEIKEALYAQGATYAAMSGSGSTIFGLFEPNSILPQFSIERWPNALLLNRVLK